MEHAAKGERRVWKKGDAGGRRGVTSGLIDTEAQVDGWQTGLRSSG